MSEAVYIPGFEDGFDKNLKFRLESIPEIPRSVAIFITGSIDNYNASYFSEKMEALIQSRYINVIFKCALLEYISSAGIGVLAKAFATIKEHGGNFVFMDLQPKVREVFQLLGFSNFFNVKASMPEVIEFFNEPKNMAATAFPVTFQCPICEAKLKAFHSGNFRCSKCKTIINVDGDGKVSI